MKKDSRHYLVSALFFCVAAAVIGIAYVSLKLQCEYMVNEKRLTQTNLGVKKNQRLDLTVQYQNISSEEEITKMASEVLGLEKGDAPVIRFDVERNKIDRIQKEIDLKYE